MCVLFCCQTISFDSKQCLLTLAKFEHFESVSIVNIFMLHADTCITGAMKYVLHVITLSTRTEQYKRSIAGQNGST